MDNPKIKIMVVEDDIPTSEYFADVITAAGYKAIVVNDSGKAMEAANSMMPQMFLLDLMMPPPDGFRLCRMLRAQECFKYTPILIVTALDDTDSKIVAMGAGASGYLAKPVLFSTLTARIRDMLDVY